MPDTLAYYASRHVQWGHWGINFYDPQPDPTRNHGVLVASLPFAVGPRGPIDGTTGSPTRNALKQACADWIASGALPAEAIAAEGR